MKIIAKRNTRKLGVNQLVKQAGFRSGFSTNDHFDVMRTLSLMKCNEYKIAIVLIDFEKAFDSVKSWSMLDPLGECRVDSRHDEI